MRKMMIAAGLVALAAAPFAASASVTPAAMDTMLVQSDGSAVSEIPVKKHQNFLPIGLGTIALVGVGVGLASGGHSGNSPS